MDIDFSVFDLDNALEFGPVPADEEYELRILECPIRRNKNDQPYLFPRFEVVGEATAEEFTHYIGIPDRSGDLAKFERDRTGMKKFFQCFGLNPNTFTPEDAIGATGWAILGVKSDSFGERNYVKKFIVSR